MIGPGDLGGLLNLNGSMRGHLCKGITNFLNQEKRC